MTKAKRGDYETLPQNLKDRHDKHINQLSQITQDHLDNLDDQQLEKLFISLLNNHLLCLRITRPEFTTKISFVNKERKLRGLQNAR